MIAPNILTILATGGGLLPPQASSVASTVDDALFVLLVISAIFFALIVGLMGLFVWKYRRRPGDVPDTHAPSHHTGLEIFWTAVPTVLLIFIFWKNYDGYVLMHTPPEKAMTVEVNARQFDWQFSYGEGVTSKSLKVPLGEPVRLVMRSSDVVHSLFVPAFRIKRDIVPGRTTVAWFEATELGTFTLYCAELCGAQHSEMRTTVEVLSPEDYQTWLKSDRFDLAKLSEPQWQAYRKGQTTELEARWSPVPTLAEHGRSLYEQHGCNACHATTKAALLGPGLAGLWGAKRFMLDGRELTVDEAYLTRSIRDPDADIPVGYDKPSLMAAILDRPEQPSDRDVAALIAFIRSLEKK